MILASVLQLKCVDLVVTCVRLRNASLQTHFTMCGNLSDLRQALRSITVALTPIFFSYSMQTTHSTSLECDSKGLLVRAAAAGTRWCSNWWCPCAIALLLKSRLLVSPPPLADVIMAVLRPNHRRVTQSVPLIYHLRINTHPTRPRSRYCILAALQTVIGGYILPCQPLACRADTK